MQTFDIRFNLVNISCISILVGYQTDFNIFIQIHNRRFYGSVDHNHRELAGFAVAYAVAPLYLVCPVSVFNINIPAIAVELLSALFESDVYNTITITFRLPAG